jgi:hypothetical protein
MFGLKSSATMLLCAMLAAGSLRANSVYLDDSFPTSVRPTLQELADDVWDLVEGLYHANPPLDLPIEIHQGEGSPVTKLDSSDDPREIRVRITSTGTHYAQFAFQLGHELSHVMLDPRRSNGIIEAICMAMSAEVLDRLGERVRTYPTLVWLKDYAPHFEEYRVEDEGLTLQHFPAEVRAMVAEHRWQDLSAYLHSREAEMEPGQAEERPLQALAAISLRSEPVDYGQLAGIAGCTTPSPEEDPRTKILPINPDCASRVSDLLERMGKRFRP